MVVYMYLGYVIIIFVYSIICCLVDYLILSREPLIHLTACFYLLLIRYQRLHRGILVYTHIVIPPSVFMKVHELELQILLTGSPKCVSFVFVIYSACGILETGIVSVTDIFRCTRTKKKM